VKPVPNSHTQVGSIGPHLSGTLGTFSIEE
jgi:hypothetical protein